ncbi:uncharacterized protein ARMOST_07177 [Armillaria ostoyae]|uniref:Uncharacterized protein n=1 Tax=Armillaria ostoyae TaxID=47428 RepID=A0A284R514_ARMOS|nr:uncharacterized protein ARMOST_07177 [Armillaria ostoyae]
MAVRSVICFVISMIGAFQFHTPAEFLKPTGRIGSHAGNGCVSSAKAYLLHIYGDMTVQSESLSPRREITPMMCEAYLDALKDSNELPHLMDLAATANTSEQPLQYPPGPVSMRVGADKLRDSRRSTNEGISAQPLAQPAGLL